jgi:hypothetical protein
LNTRFTLHEHSDTRRSYIIEDVLRVPIIFVENIFQKRLSEPWVVKISESEIASNDHVRQNKVPEQDHESKYLYALPVGLNKVEFG